MSSIVFVTEAGAEALQNSAAISTQFKLGSSFGYDPGEADDDIRGTQVFSGVPLNPVIVSPQIYRYSILLPSSLDEDFGEIALFLQSGDLFALAVFPQSISIAPNTLDSSGIVGSIDLFVRSDGTAFVDLNNGTSFAEAPSVSTLPPPQSTDAKFYVVPDPSALHVPLLVYRKNVLWNYEGYILMHEGVVLSATLGSVTILGAPSIPAHAILEFKTGTLTGVSRVVTDLAVAEGNTTVFFDAPLTYASSVGDEIMLFSSPEVNVTIGGLLADGSVPFTGDQSLGDHRLTHVGEPVQSDDAATKGYVDTAIANAPVNITGNLDLESHRIINLGAPTANGDAVRKDYVDSGFLKLDGTNVPSDDLNIGMNRLTNVASPTAGDDAVTKDYADSAFLRQDGTVGLSGNLSAGNHRVTNLGAPVASGDAVPKSYVEGLLGGMAPRVPVRAVADSNVSLSAPGATIDSAPLSNGDRVLLTNQNDPTENGVWVWSGTSTPLVRASDMTTGTISPGAFLWSEEGTEYADSLWVLITAAPITIGVTALSFYRFGTNFANGLIRADGTVAFFGNQSMAGYRLTNLGAPSGNDDAATKGYVNSFALHVDGGNTPTTTMNWGGQRLSNLGTPTASNDATTKSYVDSQVGTAWLLDGSALPSADQSLNNHKLTSVASPTQGTDAATKNYVDGLRVPRTYVNAAAVGSIDIDWAAYEVVDLTLAGTTTLTLSNPIDGKSVLFRVKQDGVGGRLFTINDTLRYSDECPALLLSADPDYSGFFQLTYFDDVSEYQVTLTGSQVAATPGYSWNGTSRTYTVVSTNTAGTSSSVSLPKGPKMWKSSLTGESVELDADVEVSDDDVTYHTLATVQSSVEAVEYFNSMEAWLYHRVTIRTLTGTAVNWALTVTTGD